MDQVQQGGGNNYQGYKFGDNANAHLGDFNLSVQDLAIYQAKKEKASIFEELNKAQRGAKLLELASKGQTARLAALLDIKVDLEHKGPKGNTALHRAILGSHHDCAKLLVSKGADVDAKGEGGNSALYLSTQRGQASMVEFLLANGAWPDIQNNENGGTALTIAADRGHFFVVEHLLNYGADVESKTAKWLDAAVQLLDGEADIEATTRQGWTALMMAAGHGHAEVVKELVKRGAKLERKGNKGMTALGWASGKEDIVKILRDAGARAPAG